MKKFFLLIASVFFCITCEKVDIDNFEFNKCTNNCAFIQGNIKDSQTNQPVGNVNIKGIFYYREEYPCWGCYDTIIGHTKSDGDGFFKLNFSVDTFHQTESYFEIIFDNKNYLSKELVVDNKVKLDSIYNTEIYMIPKSILKLTIKNLNYLNNILDYGCNIEFDRSINKNDVSDFVIHYPDYDGGQFSTFGKGPEFIQIFELPSMSEVFIYFSFYNDSAKKNNYLVNDTFFIERFEYVEKTYEL